MELIRKLQGPAFEKTAGKFLLGDNPNTYASELIAHLYKQHPYLGQYQVNISIQGQDQSMGFLYGVFLVSQNSDVPPPSGQQQMGQVISQGQPPADPKESVRIPIIVENKRAYSYDVFITPDGRFLPLSEERVASAMFDSSPYSVAPALKDTANPSAASQNISPEMPTSADGSAGGGTPLSKMSSLDFVRISKESVNDFLNKIAVDQTLVDAASINSSFAEALTKLASATPEEAAEESADTIGDFDAAVISKVSGGYRVKTAVANGNFTNEIFIENKNAETIPVDLRQAIIKHGSVLLSGNNDELLGVLPTYGLESVVDSGVYSVINKHGSAQRAAIITDVISLSGKSMGVNLVVGKSGAAIQEKVAGVQCGELNFSELAGGNPHGDGVFLFKSANAVSPPVEVKHAVLTQGSAPEFICDHPMLGNITVKTANVVRPTQETDNSFLVPSDTVFLPLEFGARYGEEIDSVEKIASRRDAINKVRIVSNGSEFSFSGKPVEHLEKNANLNSEDTLLRIGLLGDSSEGALKKLAAASRGEEVTFVPSNRIINDLPGSDADEEIANIANIIRLDLVKEAAALSGADTVDSVLSLNFITPENVQGYIDALPTFEESSSKLAELLVGVRLGLSDVPEAAVSSALRGMERAVQGLKKLQIRSNATI
jgi:hypothetical protein